MSRQTTATHCLEAAAAPDAATMAPRGVAGDERALAYVFLAANLFALAGLGATLVPHVSLPLLVGWASFTFLNALLLCSARAGLVVEGASRNAVFNTAMAAILGLAWGGGVVLFAPATPPLGYAVLMAAAFTVALVAVPLFGTQRSAIVYFLATFATLAIGGILRDARHPLLALWIGAGSATLLIIAGAWFEGHRRLRDGLRDVLTIGNGGAADGARRDDGELVTAAARLTQDLVDMRHAAVRDRRVLDALGDAVMSLDADGHVATVNGVAEVLLGWSADKLIGRPVEDVLRLSFPPDARNQAREVFEQVRRTRRPQHDSDHTQLVRRDGVIYGIEYSVTPIRDARGEFAGAAYLLRDVTEKRNRAESIAWQATHDALTGTINRAEFELRMKKLVRRAQDGSDHVHTLLYIDIDRFKFINDTFGHAAGDVVLKALAEILRTRIRGADTLARIGGDEFAALLYSCGRDKARLIAEGLRIAVENHEFDWQGLELRVSLSIGIVEIDSTSKSTPELVRAADTACYTAKRLGRNRVQLFDQDAAQSGKNARVFDFVKDIQTAIHGNRMELFYLPLEATLAAGSAALAACELSVGIRNAAGEFLTREELLDLASRYQLIEDIDRWAIKAAVDALRLNHPALDAMDLVIVPLSQQSMTDDRLLDFVTCLVREDPDVGPRLGFSFDEAGLVGHIEHVRFFVTALKECGCRFMVSDLGFGAEGIDIIKSLQADFLGIRGRLVQNMLHSTVDYEVVLGLSRIARSLGMRTVAEDVATPVLREALGKMGIEYAKGVTEDSARRVSIHSEAQWV